MTASELRIDVLSLRSGFALVHTDLLSVRIGSHRDRLLEDEKDEKEVGCE